VNRTSQASEVPMSSSALRSGAHAPPRLLSWERPGLAVLLFTGLVLRLAFLDHKSLWLDEAVTLSKALAPLSVIIPAHDEAHPPLYYLFMHFWVRLGQSEALLRLPSVIFGTLALPFLYGLSREWIGRGGALLATALLALAPLHIWYSQEARMYSLVPLLALIVAFNAVRALRGQGRGYWVAAVLAALAAIYTDYSAVVGLWLGDLVFLALVGYVSVGAGGRSPLLTQLKAWGWAHGALLLGYLPWLPLLWQQARGFIPAQLDVYTTVLFRLLHIEVTPEHWQIALLAGIAFGLLLLGLAWRHGAGAIAWLVRQRWLGGVFIVAWGLSLIAMPIPRGYFLKREILIALPFLLIGVAWAMGRMRKPQLLAAGALALSLVTSLYTLLAVPKEQWREATAWVRAQQAPGDVIALQPDYEHYVFSYYYQGKFRWIGLPSAATELDASLFGPEVKRLWLVQSTAPGSITTDELASQMDRDYPLLLSREWFRVRVRLYAIR